MAKSKFEGVAFKFSNWEKFNPRGETKKPSWFRMEKGFFSGPTFCEFDPLEKLIVVFLFCQACESNGKPIRIKGLHALQQTGVSVEILDSTLNKLVTGDEPVGELSGETGQISLGFAPIRTDSHGPVPYERTDGRTEGTDERNETDGPARISADLGKNPNLVESVKRCAEVWGRTLEHFKQPRPLIPGEDSQIGRAIQRFGAPSVELALIGIRHEKKSEQPGGFDPSQHVHLKRILDQEKFARFVGLGAAEAEKRRGKLKAMPPVARAAAKSDMGVEDEKPLSLEEIRAAIRKNFPAMGAATREPETREETGALIDAELAKSVQDKETDA